MKSKSEVREKAKILLKRRRSGIIKPNFSSLIIIFEQSEKCKMKDINKKPFC